MKTKKLYLVIAKGFIATPFENQYEMLDSEEPMEITPSKVEKYLRELLEGYIEDYDNKDISKEDFLDSFPLTVKLRMLKKFEGLNG